jgi:hypothetical protein
LKRLLFISTHNFATNPRLLKEIELALINRYQVTVLCCSFNNWSKYNNEKIKHRLCNKINYYEVSGNRKPLLPWLWSSCCFSVSKALLLIFPLNVYLLSLRSNKRSWLLMQQLNKIKEKIDLVVAHNPGSFYPAQIFAKKSKIPFGIDLEDFHPGETNNEKVSQYLKSLLKAVLPNTSYISAASALILRETQKFAGDFSGKTDIVLNLFSESEFMAPVKNNSNKLKLVWFSQNISFNRGLEQVIPVVKNNSDLELHLYGNCNELFKQQYLQSITNIFIHPVLPQIELHQLLSRYDIGLAIEPGKDLNNELALSNKILAYFQAGLYILASNTKAQQKFIEDYPHHGILTTLERHDLEKEFQNLLDQKNSLGASSMDRYVNAKAHSWETASLKLLQLWKYKLN